MRARERAPTPMDFDLHREQRLLKDSVDRLIGRPLRASRQRKGYMAEPDGWSRALWAQYADLGLLGLPFAESTAASAAVRSRP